MSLFKLGDFKLHSGSYSDWLIDCGALTDEDLETLAHIAANYLLPSFDSVVGIPEGGLRFAKQLRKYKSDGVNRELIVDDVYTTGNSLRTMADRLHDEWHDQCGLVIFARNKIRELWIKAIWNIG